MPTAARQKYLAKQAAKKADILSETDRQGEYDKVMSQLTQISAPEVDKFGELMSEWVKDAKVRQGVIPIPAIRRALCYSLGISRSKTFVSLRSDEPQKYTNIKKKEENEFVIHTGSSENGETKADEEQMPKLVPSVSSQSGTDDISSVRVPFEEPLRQVTQDILGRIGNTPIDEHYDKMLQAYQELAGEDDKLTGSVTTKPKQDSANKKSIEKKQKKQQTFVQPAPRGSRHSSKPPPTMKPKAQSA